MPTNTTNYNLVKQDPHEFYSRPIDNENLDKIDAAIKEAKDAAENIDLSQIEQSVTQVKTDLTTHLDEIMPHKFLDNGKWYRWGFRTVNGEPQMIYEEVV